MALAVSVVQSRIMASIMVTHFGPLKGAVRNFDVSLACKRFPSIIFGYSPPVELYDEASCCSGKNGLLESEICEGHLSSSVGAKWVNPDTLCETWPSLYPSLPNGSSSLFNEESSHPSPLSSQPLNFETETKSDLRVTVEDSSTIDALEGKQSVASVELILDKSISCIPGLSKRQFHQLENCGFHTLRKLLHHFPRTYADLQNAQIGIDDGQYLIFVGKILSSRAIRASYTFSFLEVVVGGEVADSESSSENGFDETYSRRKRTIYLHLKKFFRGTRFTFQPFLKSLQGKHNEGDIVCVSGKVKTMRKKDHYEMREYNMDVLEDEQDSLPLAEGRPYPIYPSKGGLNPNFLRDTISRALLDLPVNVDPIPEDVTRDFGLKCLHDAYYGIHQPKNLDDADLARKRLIFDEFFYLQLGRLFQMLEGLGTQLEKDRFLDKYRKPELNVVFMEEWSSLTKKFLKALPYSLTSSQLSAVSEIIWDLKRPVPMNRLLQGDVGCGKTIVAFLACMEVIGAGYQAAFMVPTELLAIQHYEHLLYLLENMKQVDFKPSVALLTGSTPSKQSRLIRQGLQTGDISLVIGTHSLIAENVEFSALRIAVVDEQHRFGVIQRGRFNSKLYYNSISSRMAATSSDVCLKDDVCMAPHVLAMSATPIPRTLAIALFGDMSLTQITDLPPGRQPVETFTIEANEIGIERVYKMMRDDLETGGKVYLVYPVIEQSEQLPQLRAASAELETISNRFEDYNCGLLHGKMKSDDKDEALRRFRSGQTHILLSTQVIEIGVDVPDASMMVVMNAERFGIAQLHQLRGRVGRGVRKSKCVLLASTARSLNRLKVLEESSDGFYLANMDLILRGPGDLLGKKQSGHLPEFPIARLEIDGNILQDAHLAALKILGTSHDLEKFPDLKAELSMRQPLCLLGD
ncbi:ATP-dependent DNA helicase homolog RECG, chloroplastic isoform X1 [Actinidia eriantha]|uniref:ATP-dependent DNA helicase homolog RECG, chloroplastic isoform X1 n=2 Tax=Actinidia eriantha TaxID=165200 RepID=UPI00258EAB1A|nr:ATP-dependent DNA helicase homolog RECG, chloroplastic isoform X1 [Actinidia eriantha]XP_057482235.1 ATP-dependent DNA helicase homolog RECG, chloroplastic isoform X1 [Actinidia eriantha]XP_057482245.1 ATP-dependent DNA helicase homolog RECG, chloroplastic isoform X1 [Actinidia eriantha]XP_057482253.1 ATP-dependent DNA helicase homolog RECG, chloroplastic isoform X1 [Actinidia eriantha]